MQIFQSLFASIIVLVIIAVIGILARRRGMLDEAMAGTLSRVIFDFGIPAMIFVSLANMTIELNRFEGPVIMMAVELCGMALAWIAGRRFGLDLPQLGVVVLCTGFGTSATLGYSIISIAFPNNPNAMEEAVLVSEIGVGLTIFTIGPLLAMHFGSGAISFQDLGRSLIAFAKTPICMALVSGLLWSVLGLPGEQHPLMQPVFRAGHILAGLVVPLSILIISLKLRKPRIDHIIKPFGIVVALKLLLCPLLAGILGIVFGLPEIWRVDLVIMAGLPPAVLNVILLQRYGGDATLASAVTAGASLLSLGTLLFVVAIAG
ncbi:MAG: AEC family transporter [Lewinellaceae bacterium]|nr:AEC family transporter [Saprospiraceae bacterium]MCB9331064.1 AEC family transporter [Lewinellaceae bacterium]